MRMAMYSAPERSVSKIDFRHQSPLECHVDHGFSPAAKRWGRISRDLQPARMLTGRQNQYVKKYWYFTKGKYVNGKHARHTHSPGGKPQGGRKRGSSKQGRGVTQSECDLRSQDLQKQTRLQNSQELCTCSGYIMRKGTTSSIPGFHG
jgi:hypothetical protein